MFTATTMLATWEAGQESDLTGRAVLLHGLARPGADEATLFGVPVGIRDAELVGLRCTLFGSRASLRMTCARCGGELEFDVDLGDVLPAPTPDAGSEVDGAADDGAADDDAAAGVRPPAGAVQGRSGRRVVLGEWAVWFRPPTVADVRAAAAVGPDRARSALLGRCLLAATRAGRPVPVAGLPAEVVARVGEVAAADPGADIGFELVCPDCGHRMRAVLDIAQTLWAELDAWARGTLLDVSLLADAYGWTEPDVLALSPWRRRCYLELAGRG